MDKIRFMFRDFRGRVLVSGRFLAGMLVFFFINFMCFREMPDGLKQMGYTVNFFEMVGAYMSSMVPLILFYAALAFQICAFPEWEGSQNTVLRLGKRCWFFEQILHSVLIYLIQYLVLALSVLLALFPCLVYNNQWSDFMSAACEDLFVVMQTGLNNTISFDSVLMLAGSPLYVLAVSFLLNLLCSILVSSLVILLNISRSRGTGTVFVLLLIVSRFLTNYVSFMAGEISGENGILTGVVDTVCYALMPMVQNTLTGMKAVQHGITDGFSNTAQMVWAVGYFVVLTAVVWLWSIRKIKKVDLT